MSRIGKKLIVLPAQTTLDFDPKTRIIKVKGPLGELSRELHECVILTKNEDASYNITVKDETIKFQKAIWGTTRAVVFNMVDGVSKGFTKEIELNGVGFKMELGSTQLTLALGFSHPVIVTIPSQTKLTLNKNLLSGNSIDKEEIGQFFSKLYYMKPCDVYKQKGFKYPGQFMRKKVVKKGK